MRHARSYSIVDHEVYHGGYLHRLSHEALALYLFLVVVGDREGRSYYGEATVREILRLTQPAFDEARAALLAEGLIEWRSPYWWVKSLTGSLAGGEARSPRQAHLKVAVAAQAAQASAEAEKPVDPETARSRLLELVEALKSSAPKRKHREGR